jgi:DNA replication protein DnaC
MTVATHELVPSLKRLRLSGILETLETRTDQATSEEWTYVEFLSRLLQDEVERRAQKQLARRLSRSRLHPAKTLESFDFRFNDSVHRRQVFDLATCEYVRRRRNVVIVGQTGVGKTHLAQAIAHEAIRKGFDVLLVGAHRLVDHLAAGRADDSTERRLATYLRPDLLVIDDLGLKSLPPTGASDLYDVINERYERGSIIVTSNRAPAEWHDWFGDPLLASAALDRLGHDAHVLTITGKSYRRPFETTTEEATTDEANDND